MFLRGYLRARDCSLEGIPGPRRRREDSAGALGHKAGRGDKQAVAYPLNPSFTDFFFNGPHISICVASSSTRPAQPHPHDDILIQAHNGDVITTDKQDVGVNVRRSQLRLISNVQNEHTGGFD